MGGLFMSTILLHDFVGVLVLTLTLNPKPLKQFVLQKPFSFVCQTHLSYGVYSMYDHVWGHY